MNRDWIPINLSVQWTRAGRFSNSVYVSMHGDAERNGKGASGVRALAPVATTLPVGQQRTGSEPFHQHHVAGSSLLADGPCGRVGIGVIPGSRSGHGIELQYHQPARLPCALEDFETPSPHAVAASSRGDGCCRELAIELEPFRVFDFNVDNQKRRHASMLSRKQGHMTPLVGQASTGPYRPRIRLHGVETNAPGWHTGATPYAAPPLGKGNPDGPQYPTAIADQCAVLVRNPPCAPRASMASCLPGTGTEEPRGDSPSQA
jgi:hypothetical protein